MVPIFPICESLQDRIHVPYHALWDLSLSVPQSFSLFPIISVYMYTSLSTCSWLLTALFITLCLYSATSPQSLFPGPVSYPSRCLFRKAFLESPGPFVIPILCPHLIPGDLSYCNPNPAVESCFHLFHDTAVGE